MIILAYLYKPNNPSYFLQTVADAITSDLPYAGKRLKEAFVLIVEGFKNVIDTPVQAFSIMRRGGTQ